MIRENTVVIVGAGASTPYGYPTGYELRQLICDKFPDLLNRLITNMPLLNYAGSPKEVQDAVDFAQAFRESRVRSIDRYLAINKEFSDIGKLAIVLTILKVEEAKNFKDDLKDNWYFYLYNRMIDGYISEDSYKQFSKNNITFITFNYDRSIEHYFFKSLRHTFRKASENDIIEQLNQIKICHVYGQVDYLPWQGGKKPYGFRYGHEEILDIIPNIKTMFEITIPDQEELKTIIRNAKAIYFLGFGYDKSNMKVIGLPNALNPSQHISGTYKGAKEKEKNDLIVFLMKKKGVNRKLLNFSDCGCVDLLRAHL